MNFWGLYNENYLERCDYWVYVVNDVFGVGVADSVDCYVLLVEAMR